ncbi:hypothetical protein, unknown function [Leishmania tarentolae]|uniref:Uncharacterized protein n=1 Tax=Leishmania tarentolae TaxID=5689 RepID=A0A640KPF9_LEITA|nr:hypothetical protein, unknown function [Leishmania tarentolae]
MSSTAAMLSSSDHREDRPLSSHGTGSSSRVDLMSAASNPLTNPYASSLPNEGAVAPRGCGRNSSSTTRPTSPWLDRRCSVSTSLDADDEADGQSPVNPSEAALTPLPLTALTLDYCHRERKTIDNTQDGSHHAAKETGEATDADPSTDTPQDIDEQLQLAMPADAAVSGTNGSAPAQTLVRWRSIKRGTSPNSPHPDPGRIDNSPRSSLKASFPEAVPFSAKACAPSVQSSCSTTRSPHGEVPAATRAPAAVVMSTDSVLPAQAHRLHDDSDDATNGSATSSPPAFPLLLATATAKSLGGLPALHSSGTPPSPLARRLQLHSQTAVQLQHFGCCVFFFPAPFVSWLFPLVGHVAISNAEGSRLYTFESSYYVREEKLMSVLDCVLREEGQGRHTGSLLRENSHAGSRADLSALPMSTSLRSSMPSQLLGMSVASDASASDTAVTSPSDAGAGSQLRFRAISPVFPSHCSARPPRRSGRQRSAAGAPASGHAHTQCVRIWDLKPLLMESRGRRTRRTPCGLTTQGGKQAAAVLWERLQGLLQPTEVSTAPMQGASTAGSAASTTLTPTPSMLRVKRQYASEYHSDDVDGTRSAPGMSSSGEEEGEEYELLDAETARFYNRNLNATIRLFRGSADGSINSPDVVLQHHSSFSFVGFVLEACGVGSQGKSSSAVSAPKSLAKETGSGGGAVTSASPAAENSPATTSASDDAVPGECLNSEEEIHWGVMKLLFHVSVFGKWYRGERRLWRVVHGGSITSASILWAAIIALTYHYFTLLFF